MAQTLTERKLKQQQQQTIAQLEEDLKEARALAIEAFRFWRLRCWSAQERERQKTLMEQHFWISGAERR